MAAGLLRRVHGHGGHCTVQVTDLGLQAMVHTRQQNRLTRSPHQALVDKVSTWLQHTQGRLVWQGPKIRSPLVALEEGATTPGAVPADAMHPGAATDALFEDGAAMPTPQRTRWRLCIPDVYSVRHSSVQAYLEPAIYEIKVSRADLLSDLGQPDKRGAYRAVASQLWYVLGLDRRGQPIAAAHEIPPPCGVIVEGEGGAGGQLTEGVDGEAWVALPAAAHTLRVLRLPVVQPMRELPFHVWMALVKSPMAGPGDVEPAQAPL